MLLSDRDLRKEVESGRLVLEPFDDLSAARRKAAERAFARLPVL